ncbi:MAG: TraB/GumN family protein [Pseudomonadota bacterium]
MKNSMLKSSILAVAAAISSFSLASSPVLAQETAAAPAAAETVDIDPALWVVKDKDTTIYLFGTVHILKPGLSWFDEAVKEAFDASDELVLEIVGADDPASQQKAMAMGTDEVTGPFREKLTPENKAAYETALGSLGIPAAGLDQFEPWLASITLGVVPLLAKGYDVNSGAEKVLTAQAENDGKTLGQLETVEQQLGFFDDLPEENQIAMLNAAVAAIPEIESFVDSMVTTWGSGDTEKLAALMNEGFSDKLVYDALLTKRNANWAEWIDTRLETPGTVFIAVGAGHLAGDTSVQAQLAKKNITTSRIEY